jgi:ligand-binding sensor domain-containing protein
MSRVGHDLLFGLPRLRRRASALPRLAVWAAAFGLLAASALGSTDGTTSYSVRTWQMDDGLLSNQIRCLLEGRDGALWIGGEGGLTRFMDGKLSNFTEKNGLSANSVKGLCEVGGVILVATAYSFSWRV